MKQSKSINLVKRGMSRDKHPQQLQQIEYSLAVNINTNNEEGNSVNVQLEPSNHYGVQFPNGYKVIGLKTDLLKERTYYFLVNTEEADNTNENYRRSSIGYVDLSRVLNLTLRVLSVVLTRFSMIWPKLSLT